MSNKLKRETFQDRVSFNEGIGKSILTLTRLRLPKQNTVEHVSITRTFKGNRKKVGLWGFEQSRVKLVRK